MRRDHALIAPETHVAGPVPGWTGAEHVLLIGPPMGARFTMALARMGAGRAWPARRRPGAGRAVYVLEGELTLDGGGRRARRSAPAASPTCRPTPPTRCAAPAARARLRHRQALRRARRAPRAGCLLVGDAARLTPVPLLGDPSLRVTQPCCPTPPASTSPST